MNCKPMIDDEPLYTVTLHRCDDRPSVTLITQRTATEVEQLRAKGHRITTSPPMANERRTPFSEALAAISRLRNHAAKSGDDGLRDRADRAVIELLRGSGLSFDDDSDGRPSMKRRATPPGAVRKLEHTIPGIGGRR
jgi:hypothetical protein